MSQTPGDAQPARDDITVFPPEDYLEGTPFDAPADLLTSDAFFRHAVLTPENTGTDAIGAVFFVLPPGKKSNQHIHPPRTHTAIYVMSGVAVSHIGPNGENVHHVRAGSFIYVPPGVPHFVTNEGDETIVAIVVRTYPGDEDTELEETEG